MLGFLVSIICGGLIVAVLARLIGPGGQGISIIRAVFGAVIATASRARVGTNRAVLG